MNTKLTLKLNKKSMERAKRNKQSLSRMVGNYFEIISDEELGNDLEISPNVLDLSGIIKLSDNFDIKDLYGKHLLEKHSK